MGLSRQFATDRKLETQGIIIDYGTDRVRIARAGGSNKKYEKLLESKTKHLRRALIVGAIGNDQSMAILRDVFAETIVLGWEVNTGTETVPKWEKGIDPKDAGEKADKGKLLSCNATNYKKVFINLPDLFLDIQQQAQAGALYRTEINEADSGN